MYAFMNEYVETRRDAIPGILVYQKPLYLLETGFSLNLELSWMPARSSYPLLSVSHGTGAWQGTICKTLPCPFYWLWGLEFRLLWLCGKHSYLRSQLWSMSPVHDGILACLIFCMFYGSNRYTCVYMFVTALPFPGNVLLQIYYFWVLLYFLIPPS